jgi:hypothetical protein
MTGGLSLIECCFPSVVKSNLTNSLRKIPILRGRNLWNGQLWNKLNPTTSFLIPRAVISSPMFDCWLNSAKSPFPYLQPSLEYKTPIDHQTSFHICF